MAGSNEEAGDSSGTSWSNQSPGFLGLLFGHLKTDHMNVVIIKLIADDTVKEFRTRTITLTEFNNTLRIGRASKVSTKGFVPAPDSAWFDSPVMSRNHAEIVANFQDKVEPTFHLRYPSIIADRLTFRLSPSGTSAPFTAPLLTGTRRRSRSLIQ